MSKEKENKMVPRLRFPEFRGTEEWQETTLAQVAEYENGKAHENDISESGKYIVVNSKFISTNGDVRKFSDAAYCLAAKDDLLMVLSDVPNGRAIAKSFYVEKDNLYTVNQRICRITPINSVGSFLYNSINRNPYFLAFDDGVKQTNLRKEDVLSCPILLPKEKQEQQKIATCLSSLDHLITAHSQKLEALKTHKKGLMQQLFPAEGETVPRLRFEEFRDSGEWKEKILEKIAPLQRGFDLPSDQIKQGIIPVVYSNGIQNYHSIGMAKGPGLVTGRSGTIGKIHFIENGEYWPHNTTLWVTSFKENYPKFIFYLYCFIGLNRFSSGSGVPTLNRNDVHAFKVFIPTSISEQQKIASCLSSLDELISAQGKKIEALKAHKKGLMQGLFPDADSASDIGRNNGDDGHNIGGDNGKK